MFNPRAAFLNCCYCSKDGRRRRSRNSQIGECQGYWGYVWADGGLACAMVLEGAAGCHIFCEGDFRVYRWMLRCPLVNNNNMHNSLARKKLILNSPFLTPRQVSKEGDTFEVPVDIAKLSTLVVTTLGEDGDDDDDMVEIPLPNVKATVLAKVIEYCTHYKQVEPSEFE